MVTNAELASKVAELEERVVVLEAAEFLDTANARLGQEEFDDLLAGVMAALVRSRSQGAMATAKALADKYLPEGTEIQSYGEAFVTSSGLYSSGKADE